MNAEEIELDALPGLPSSELPPGEQILWQGRPQWRTLAREAFKIRWIALYFAVFLVARLVSVLSGDQSQEGALQLLVMTLLFGTCLAVCALMAWLQARSAIYTITTHRVVMQVGAACPITWNLPFQQLAAADLTVRGEDDGDVSLRLTGSNRVAWLHFWPHARRGRRLEARPTLRGIAEPRRVAAKLEEAVRQWSAEHGTNPGVFVDAAVGEAAPAPERSIHVGRLASEANP